MGRGGETYDLFLEPIGHRMLVVRQLPTHDRVSLQSQLPVPVKLLLEGVQHARQLLPAVLDLLQDLHFLVVEVLRQTRDAVVQGGQLGVCEVRALLQGLLEGRVEAIHLILEPLPHTDRRI